MVIPLTAEYSSLTRRANTYSNAKLAGVLLSSFAMTWPLFFEGWASDVGSCCSLSHSPKTQQT